MITISLTRTQVEVLQRVMDFYEANPDLEDGCEDAEGNQIENQHDNYCAVLEEIAAKLSKAEPSPEPSIKDVHTEHCNYSGCKYGEEDFCPVTLF